MCEPRTRLTARRFSLAVLVLAATLSASTIALGVGPCPDDPSGAACLRGAASQSYESDSNRCVPDVIAQFDNLKDHGEIMGFRDGGRSVGYPPLDTDDQHWQGVQRLGFPADRRNFM